VAAVLFMGCHPKYVQHPTTGGGTTIATGGTGGSCTSDASCTGGATSQPEATGGRQPCVWAASRGMLTARGAPQNRIVGGSVAPAGRYPWVVSLQQPDGWHYCGGALLPGGVAVLTAAHCQVAQGDRAVLGCVDRTSVACTRRTVVETRNNPMWSDMTSGSDVAIAVLDSPVTDVLALVSVEVNADCTGDATVIGWGLTREGGTRTEVLQRYVDVPLWPQALCEAAYPGAIDATMLCAGAMGEDSCQGDSGGPLVVATPDGDRQIGIVSWGEGCARQGKPGVYTSLESPVVANWIVRCTP
jgi:secreted trypsin-like serine protease